MDIPVFRMLKESGKTWMQENKNRVKLSFNAVSGAQDKTRTCTNAIVHYPLKVACLPISPPGHHTPRISFGPANIGTILRFAKFFPEKLRFFPDSEIPDREISPEEIRGGIGRTARSALSVKFAEPSEPPPGLSSKRGVSPPSEIRPALRSGRWLWSPI